MAVKIEGSNIVVDSDIAGSLFPKSEREIAYPVLIDGTKADNRLTIEGSVYGRSIEIRGGVSIHGPVVSRGDTRLVPSSKGIELLGGLTVNGILNGLPSTQPVVGLETDIENATTVIRGDVAVNQNISLENAIVFGSIKALNCRLQNCVVLGTVVVSERLLASMSAIGGYSASEATFEGACILLHALGESASTPIFVPCELASGEIVASDVRYYPAMRQGARMVNLVHRGVQYPEYSQLNPQSDWVRVNTKTNAVDATASADVVKWVLSIGGRIGDFAAIKGSIDSLTAMLKCGFEFDHLDNRARQMVMSAALKNLTQDESWILKKVCRQ